MRDIIKVLIIIILFSANSIFAQEIEKHTFSSGGGYSEAGNYKLSFSIGQAIVGNPLSGSLTITQGYMTGKENNGVNLKPEYIELFYKITPNPTSDFLQIEIASAMEVELSLSLINILGETVLKQEIVHLSNNTVVFGVKDLPSGIYYISFSTANEHLSTVPILKN